MAIEIKSIPVLKDDIAKRFVENANKSYDNRETIDFSEEVKSTNKILEKAKMK